MKYEILHSLFGQNVEHTLAVYSGDSTHVDMMWRCIFVYLLSLVITGVQSDAV